MIVRAPMGFQHRVFPRNINAFGSLQNQGGGTAVVPYPSPILAGRPISFITTSKYDPDAPTDPAGFTRLAQVSGGAGASGVDSGIIVHTLYTKIADGTEIGDLTLTIPSANSSISRMFTWRSFTAGHLDHVPGTWDLAAATGTRNLADANFTVTFGTDPGIQRDDICAVFCGFNRNDQGTPAPNNRTTLVVPGCDMSYGTVRGNSGATWGDDCGHTITSFQCLYGTSTGVATYAAAMSGTPAGAAILLRLRWTPS